jgi:hypothetical protein
MARTPLRRLTLEGRTFLWRRLHTHAPAGAAARDCAERVVVFLEGAKRGPLELFFREDASWKVGYPQSGALFRAEPLRVYDLHRPKVIAALVRHALGVGWAPETARAPFMVQDGLAFLEAAGAPTGFAGVADA